MNVMLTLQRAREIYAGMSPYDEGDQRRTAVAQAVREAGISRQNAAWATNKLLQAWERLEQQQQAAASAAINARPVLPAGLTGPVALDVYERSGRTADRAKIAAALVKDRREAELQDRAAPDRVREAAQKWEAENRPAHHGVFTHTRRQWTEMDGDRPFHVEGTVTEFHRNDAGLAALAAATAEIEQRLGPRALAAWDAANGADWAELAPERAALEAAEQAAEKAKWAAINRRHELRYRLNYAEPVIERVIKERMRDAWISRKEDRLVLSASFDEYMKGNHIGEFVVTPDGDCAHWKERAAQWAEEVIV